jgi:hypothetical protein
VPPKGRYKRSVAPHSRAADCKQLCRRTANKNKFYLFDRKDLIAQELAGFRHNDRLARYLSAIRCDNEYRLSGQLCISVELLAEPPVTGRRIYLGLKAESVSAFPSSGQIQ